jgi:antitoxin MazE
VSKVHAVRFDQGRDSNYNVIMKASLVAIGNSRGVRIPKALLEQTGLQDEVEMEVQGSQIVIRSAHRVREGWDEAFARMAANGDDALLDAPVPTEWDQSEWEW